MLELCPASASRHASRRVASRADLRREVALPARDGAYRRQSVVGLLSCGPDVQWDIGSVVLPLPCFPAVSDHLPLSSMSAEGHVTVAVQVCFRELISRWYWQSLQRDSGEPSSVETNTVPTHCQCHSLSTCTSFHDICESFPFLCFRVKTSKKAPVSFTICIEHDWADVYETPETGSLHSSGSNQITAAADTSHEDVGVSGRISSVTREMFIRAKHVSGKIMHRKMKYVCHLQHFPPTSPMVLKMPKQKEVDTPELLCYANIP